VIEAERRIRDALLIGLSFIAGIVDAMSFLGLGAIFTANMTGNTVFLALALGERNPLLAARTATALVGFSAGAVGAGRILGTVKDSLAWPPRVTWVLTAELGLVVAFNALWVVDVGRPAGASLYVLIAVMSAAMGMQSAGARHLAVPGVSTTTVITTQLTGLMAEFAALGVSGSSAKRTAATILALFSGAAIGGAFMVTSRVVPPFLVTASVGVICAVALTRFGSAGKHATAQVAPKRADEERR
jgi:uncharacterized membrane protein YoaK (UPF0700 family)